MLVFPLPKSDPLDRGDHAKPTRGAQLLVSFLTGGGTRAARLSGSVAPKKPSGEVESSYRNPRLSVRSGRTWKSSCTKKNVCHCLAVKSAVCSACWNLNATLFM